MKKKKLRRFAENLTFPNMFQYTFADIQSKGDFFLKGRWHEDFFLNTNPIVLELGCGKGEYTVGLAQKYPNKNFIGIDIKGARMWRGCKTSNDENMENVAFLRTQIQFLETFFLPGEVSEIWITFPDPQPHKPNKRLSSERFLSYYRKVLKENGTVHLKTDSWELYDYTLNEVIRPKEYLLEFFSDDLYQSGITEDVINIQTFYESMFLEQGKKITYLKFKI